MQTSYTGFQIYNSIRIHVIWGIYVHESCMCIGRAIDSSPIWRAYKCPLKRIVPCGVPFKFNSFLAAVNHVLLQHQLVPLSEDPYRAKEKQTVL